MIDRYNFIIYTQGEEFVVLIIINYFLIQLKGSCTTHG